MHPILIINGHGKIGGRREKLVNLGKHNIVSPIKIGEKFTVTHYKPE